jgi:hypothetical protein
MSIELPLSCSFLLSRMEDDQINTKVQSPESRIRFAFFSLCPFEPLSLCDEKGLLFLSLSKSCLLIYYQQTAHYFAMPNWLSIKA